MQAYVSSKKTITLPSGREVIIREQNGADDDVLSNIASAEKGQSIAQFISGIVQEDKVLGRKPSFEDILNWPVNDMYYALLMSRIFSLGAEISFDVECAKDTCKLTTTFEEDLENFTLDLNQRAMYTPEFYKKPENKYKVLVYPLGSEKDVVITLSTGKVVRYEIMTVKTEVANMLLPREKLTVNRAFISRNIQLKAEESSDYIPIGEFSIFSPKEMAEIRTSVNKNDKSWQPTLECVCPNCKTTQNIPLIEESAFFYPLGK